MHESQTQGSKLGEEAATDVVEIGLSQGRAVGNVDRDRTGTSDCGDFAGQLLFWRGPVGSPRYGSSQE